MAKRRWKTTAAPFLVPLWTRPPRGLTSRQQAPAAHANAAPPLHFTVGSWGEPSAIAHRPFTPLPPIKGSPKPSVELTSSTAPPHTSPISTCPSGSSPSPTPASYRPRALPLFLTTSRATVCTRQPRRPSADPWTRRRRSPLSPVSSPSPAASQASSPSSSTSGWGRHILAAGSGSNPTARDTPYPFAF
jgi:hypothetical protein